jgi:hypothetical protein
MDWDDAFTILANRRRRRLVVALLGHNPQQDRVDIPDGVSFEEEDVARLQSELEHVHLPKLEAAGYISWDREQQEIRKGPKFDEIRPLLELIERHRGELPDGWL